MDSYVYSCYFDGVQVATAITVNDVVMDDLTVGTSQSGPLIGNTFLGNIDDLVVDPKAVYTGASLQVPTE